MSETQFIAEPGIPQVQMIREFAAPPEVLLRAYTEPEPVSYTHLTLPTTERV